MSEFLGLAVGFSAAPGKLSLGLGRDSAVARMCPEPASNGGILWSLVSEHNEQVSGLPRATQAKNCDGIAKDLSGEACYVRVQGCY